jgi:ribonuclease BN (tRNA processing enzyme)
MNPNQSPIKWENEDLCITIPFSQPGVATSLMITSKRDQSLLICDTGDGVLHYLVEHQLLNTYRLSGLLFTHDHYDHLGSLMSVLGYLRLIEHTADLPVVFPSGSGLVPDMLVLYEQHVQRIPYPINRVPVDERTEFQLNSWTIESYKTDHWGSICIDGASQAFDDGTDARCYVLKHASTQVGISGDTGNTPILHTLAPRLDCFFLEATFRDSHDREPIFYDKVHLSESLAREIGKKAKAYRLYHSFR